MLHIHLISEVGIIGRLVFDEPNGLGPTPPHEKTAAPGGLASTYIHYTYSSTSCISLHQVNHGLDVSD